MSILLRVGVILILLGAAYLAAERGLVLRREVWDQTMGVRFEGDVGNGFNWGNRSFREGIFQLYDNLYTGRTSSGAQAYALDYPPLRLAAVTLWAKWANDHYPQFREWENNYDLTMPMLSANTLAEGVASILVFAIILLLKRRMHRARGLSVDAPAPQPIKLAVSGFIGFELLALAMLYFTGASLKDPAVTQFWLIPVLLGAMCLGTIFVGVGPALFGAFILWFNPAVIWDGHVWPQWDVWLVPFFLAALLLACLDCWFIAGLLLPIGFCLKGQMLLGMPILILWPLCQLRFDAVLRIVAGMVLSMCLIMIPWLNVSYQPMIFTGVAVLGMSLLMPFVLRWNWDWRFQIAMSVIALLMAVPWRSEASFAIRLLPVALMGMIALARFVPPKIIPHIYALGIGLMGMLLMPVHGGSAAWYRIGFEGATEKYHTMLTGTGAMNLPAVMRSFYRWPTQTDSSTMLPLIGQAVPFRTSMVIIYAICLLLLGIGAAVHYRRNDTRFLVAMAAPWVIAYCLMTQMHGRYLIWGAAMSALLAGTSVGMALLGISIGFLAWFGMAYNQFYWSPGWDRPHYAMLQLLIPHLGWMLLLAAAIYLYFGAVPRTRATKF